MHNRSKHTTKQNTTTTHTHTKLQKAHALKPNTTQHKNKANNKYTKIKYKQNKTQQITKATQTTTYQQNN